jgi:hypothetical protein
MIKRGVFFLLSEMSTFCAAHSFGIAEDVSWDATIAERGMDVFMYEHTSDKLP